MIFLDLIKKLEFFFNVIVYRILIIENYVDCLENLNFI